MRNVVFAAPFPLETTLRFARALRSLDGVRLLGLFQEPPAESARGLFDDVVRVGDALDPDSLTVGAKTLASRHGPLHRILGVLEELQVPLATARERLGVEGPTVAIANRFRDKAHMKDVLRAAGLPCARHKRLESLADARAFAAEVGFPQVLKPLAGAGSRSTFRVDSADELERIVEAAAPSRENPVLAEEFLVGAEHSFETLTLGGQVMFSSIGRYHPTPLEVVRTPWIQWCVVLPRDVSIPAFDDARAVGTAAVTALGLEDGMTHMEWFRRPDGTLAIGEIAARPPGANIVRLMSHAHDADLYRAWARAVVDRAYDGPWERRYATGCAFFRGVGGGRVARVEGMHEAQAKIGHLVVEARLPQVGAPKSASYEGDGWAIVRHPDTRVVEEALSTLIRTVRVRYA